ncbi:uncharacterized protein LOC144477602, partial [Augochlora pura]
ISIPRLESYAALRLAEHHQAVSKALDIQVNKVNFCSNSKSTSRWIRIAPHTLKPFVTNRVAKIQKIAKDYNWRYVISTDNPADSLSRGQLPGDFLTNRLWLNGPTWLPESPTGWPSIPIPNIEVLEQRAIVSLTSEITSSEYLNRFSSWTSLQRAIAYCVRFCKNASRSEQNTGALSIYELNRAHNHIIKNVQGRHFAREYNNLKRGISVHKDSKILALTPFIDDEGIIRIGGRLQKAALGYNQKYPILFAWSGRRPPLIFEYGHKGQSHTCIVRTLHAVRQEYWPIDGKYSARFIIRKRIRDFKVKQSNPVEYLRENLPRDRTMATNGVKVYLVVFVWVRTKAVHREIVSELSIEAFTTTLKGFFSRHDFGSPMYSNNATYLYQYVNNENVSWHFSTPRSPHFGGLWKTRVKAFKHHLHRTDGDARFSCEPFYTCMVGIEAVLNSQPLTPLSLDPNILRVLTPAHFLIDESLTTSPERDKNRYRFQSMNGMGANPKIQTTFLDSLVQRVPKRAN